MKRLIAIMAIALSGCSTMNAPTRPSEEMLRTANYGDKPAPDVFEKAIKEWAIDALRDPESIQIRDMTPTSSEGWLSVCTEIGMTAFTPCATRTFYFGHLVTAKINAKNASGGYVGYETYKFLFRGDKITGHSVLRN